MDPEVVPASPNFRSRTRLQRLSVELQRDWSVTVRLFQQYRELAPHRRYRALGELFERLCPWIERGINTVTWTHFVLIPTEQVISRAFALSTQKEALPKSYVLYIHWVESLVMRGLAKREELLSHGRSSSTDPNGRVCARFNSLNYQERELLYLYIVEGCSPTEVADNTGVPFPQVLEAVPKLWARVRGNDIASNFPSSWQVPAIDASGILTLHPSNSSRHRE